MMEFLFGVAVGIALAVIGLMGLVAWSIAVVSSQEPDEYEY